MTAMAPLSVMILMALAKFSIAVGVDNVDLTNSTISCNWPSATGLVGDIQAYKLNVTDVVSQCSNVCEMAFASSSPDIAGKGVFISLLIQTALACFFGPLLPILIWLITLVSWRTLIRSIPLFRSLQYSVYEINAFFSILLAVATIVLHHQDPSIMEVTYISQMSTMQLMLLVSMVWGLYGDHEMNRSRDSKLDFTWGLYYAAIGIAQIATSYTIGLPDGTVSVYKQLAKECQDHHKLPHFATYIGSTSSSDSAIKYLGIGAAIGAGISILGCILAIPLAKLHKRIIAIIPQWLKTHGVGILLTIILLFYTSLVILDALMIGDFRTTWRKISGDLFHDNEWGFGQTTAILLWAPFAWAMIKGMIKNWRESPPKAKNESEMQALDPEAAIPQVAEAVPPPYSSEDSPPKHSLP